MTAINMQLIKNHQHTFARVTKVATAHGEFMTPAFMPVATRAFVNHMTPEDLVQAGSEIILGGNTYHMLCAPGMQTLQELGGMHQLMHWSRPMLTDSGGFQVFSLSKNSKICKINELGAKFKHPVSGQLIELTPASSIAAQKIIGADIIMAFDQCTPEAGGREVALKAMERTHRWLRECVTIQAASPKSAYGFPQGLFGIIQGGSFRDLREQSAEFVTSLPLDGVAIGGEVIGFDRDKTQEVIDWVRPLLPVDKTRYTMGVGLHPEDLLHVVRLGIDIFDCVAPTRNARHGSLYHGQAVPEGDWLRWESHEPRGKIVIKRAIYARDEQPIDPNCQCYTCSRFSRGYLHYLYKTNASLYYHLACIHNVTMMHATCRAMRDLILLT